MSIFNLWNLYNFMNNLLPKTWKIVPVSEICRTFVAELYSVQGNSPKVLPPLLKHNVSSLNHKTNCL
ncbi:hypothetical protein C5O19_04680 [Siphonobacter curvatus]|uniref:Uncharacterized protein n=1 Tax=Siphonobacter curvatus TaxID=2094562 RepID=A0A2S7IMX3_9BACT|nr:hypothetical protein C5O19_04680 [Siphonobacter curvatus]